MVLANMGVRTRMGILVTVGDRRRRRRPQHHRRGRAARQTTEGVSRSQQATAEPARMSAELTSLVSAFRY
jgi:hypothetical protein